MSDRDLDARVARAMGVPLEPPCGRYHQTDGAEYDATDGWSGWCYTCNESISAVAPEPLRYSTSLDAVRLVEAEIERRRLQAAYVLALAEACGFTVPVDAPLSARQLWLLAAATPAQRCRAAVAVLEGGENNA